MPIHLNCLRIFRGAYTPELFLSADALSTTQKAEFSLNLLLNQKAIKAAIDELKNPKP